MKLKQKIALGLGLFYLVNVIGIALSLHFCGGRLADVKLYSSITSCKICGSMASADKAQSGCCKNTKIEVKVKDDHQTSAQFKLPKLFASDLFLPTIFKIDFTFPLPLVLPAKANKAPPALQKLAIYLLNCVFRN